MTRSWMAAAALAPLALLAPVPMLVISTSTSQPATCSTVEVPSAGHFTGEQVTIARVAARLADQRKLPGRAKLVILATGLQESGIRNLSYGDRDSVGWLQQRAGWGSVAQRMDPAYAAGRFYDALVRVPSWQGMAVTEAAQAVQI